jgi:hypothetical protein
MREGTMVSMQAGKTGTLRGLAFATLLLAGGAPMAQQGATDIARLEKLKSSVVEGVESRRKLSQVMNDTVFSFGELAYQELETSLTCWRRTASPSSAALPACRPPG